MDEPLVVRDQFRVGRDERQRLACVGAVGIRRPQVVPHVRGIERDQEEQAERDDCFVDAPEGDVRARALEVHERRDRADQ